MNYKPVYKQIFNDKISKKSSLDLKIITLNQHVLFIDVMLRVNKSNLVFIPGVMLENKQGLYTQSNCILVY